MLHHNRVHIRVKCMNDDSLSVIIMFYYLALFFVPFPQDCYSLAMPVPLNHFLLSLALSLTPSDLSSHLIPVLNL